MYLRRTFLTFFLIIITGSMGSYALSGNSNAVNSSSAIFSYNNKTIYPDSLLLTKQKVKDWMQTRIAIAELQKEMKNNASAYEDVVQEFYAKRADLLQSRDWSVDEFDAVKERIHAAISAMDIADELEEGRADHEKEVVKIKENDFYSDEQKQELINALSKMREQKRTQFVEPTKPDWPAVKKYRLAFNEMSSWIAGNTSTIPIIE